MQMMEGVIMLPNGLPWFRLFFSHLMQMLAPLL